MQAADDDRVVRRCTSVSVRNRLRNLHEENRRHRLVGGGRKEAELAGRNARQVPGGRTGADEAEAGT